MLRLAVVLAIGLATTGTAGAQHAVQYQDDEAACMGIWDGILREDIGVDRLEGHDKLLSMKEVIHKLRMSEMESGIISNEEGLRLSEVERHALRITRSLVLLLDDVDRRGEAHVILDNLLDDCANHPILVELSDPVQ